MSTQPKSSSFPFGAQDISSLKNILDLYMYMYTYIYECFAYMHLHTIYMLGVCRGQKRALDSLELELWIAM